mgnify:CR=1 FL=1
MTDKERLEEARLMAEMLRVETRLPHDFPFDLVDWLVEQAERVWELERKIERYREALVFYADENNYREQELKGIVPPRPITFKPILHDYGSIARQALEEEI